MNALEQEVPRRTGDELLDVDSLHISGHALNAYLTRTGAEIVNAGREMRESMKNAIEVTKREMTDVHDRAPKNQTTLFLFDEEREMVFVVRKKPKKGRSAATLITIKVGMAYDQQQGDVYSYAGDE